MDLGLLLGNDYERRKIKLKQELQLDYKNYVAKPGQFRASDAACISPPASPRPILNAFTNIHPPPREHAASRRDAATLTEAVDNGKRGPAHRGRRRWQLHKLKEPCSSEEQLITDTEEELEFRHKRKQDRYSPKLFLLKVRYDNIFTCLVCLCGRDPQDTKRVETPGVHDQNNSDSVWKSDLQMPDSMRTTARSRPATSKHKAEFATGLMIGTTEEQTDSQMRKERYKQELLKQIAEQQRNKIREKKLGLRVAATGATDPEKEPDRIKQFGAINRQYDSWRPGIDLEDPNQRPKDDKHTEGTEQRAPQGKSHVDYSSTALHQLQGKVVPGSGTGAAQGVPLLDYFNEDYHRDFSNMLGEVDIPRVADAAPPAPPTVTNNYKTPYDAAYYYYGTRNPLDPNLPYNQNGESEGVQQSGNFHSLTQRPPPLSGRIKLVATNHHRASHLDAGEPPDKSKQRRENALSYQEALRQQIKEREERKRREKEEKERYDAKIEAEMMAYNPWGRSGGGAPIKDEKGNLVSDLNQMHRFNEESCRNPVSRNSGQTQGLRNEYTLRFEARTPLSHRLSGSFRDQPTPQQLRMQDRYKEELRKQIEENKRKQEEERERIRTEEQKEEKRLAEQRARIQREYEEEQKRRKKAEHRLDNQIWKHQPKTQHQVEEKKVREEQEVEQKEPESTRDREEKKSQLNYEREPSPPIPTLQKNRTNLVAFRPSSVVSQHSSRTERTVSAPHNRPVPTKIPQLPDGKQEVIRELSALRRYLRKEQRQLEVQLGQTDPQETHFTPPNRPREQPKTDATEPAQKPAAQPATQPSTRSPSCDAAHFNMQNIREFNQLKYRDTASREEVRHMYPDPPADAQSLDIQQQALLREQQRQMRLMKREEERDFLDQQLSHYPSRNKPGRYIHRDSILPSDTAFIDFYGGDACEEPVHQQRPPQPLAEHRERTAPRRRHDDEAAVSINQRNREIQPDAQSLQSVQSKIRNHNQQHITRQDPRIGEANSRSEGLSGDEEDVLSLRSALERRVSVETVATEPWLRPGTSDAVKRSGCRERPHSRMDAPPWLTHRIT
ncbi:hypothetical protein L3Q82_018103 [Scortum barcoo]|uniref:Uncharacterized protein n=1 Tax=Scortum barcoo TaxID=214431 RepID=A0ACB8VHW3_9TELE|nr:hypothetical protein L3Q82_018103 [Scortum barcoo]